jgi:hypothetical protein
MEYAENSKTEREVAVIRRTCAFLYPLNNEFKSPRLVQRFSAN